MNGRTMNLLPPSVRARVDQVETRKRLMSIGMASVALLMGAWLYGGLRASEAEKRHNVAEERAAEVLATENQGNQMLEELSGMEARITAYRSVQLPFKVSHLLATIVNELPGSITFDRMDLDATSLVAAPIRGVGNTGSVAPPRIMRGELQGVAATDLDVARLVEALRARRPIEEVEVETSRHTRIGPHPARAFRLAFSIDLESLDAAVGSSSIVVMEGDGE